MANRQELLTTWLQTHDAQCPVCAYNTRGCPSASCPECGAVLELRLTSPFARVGPWLVGVIGLAIPLGFYTLFGLTALVLGWLLGRGSPTDRTQAIIGLVVAVPQAIILVLLVRQRAHFLARASGAQWRLAITLALVSAAVFAAVLAGTINA